MGSRKIITYYNVELILIYNWPNWKQNFLWLHKGYSYREYHYRKEKESRKTILKDYKFDTMENA